MPSNTAPPGNASNLDLAYQVILALPHVKTREDGLALLGVLDRAGGLDQGNLKFRLADIITEKPPGKFLIEFLTERNILLDGEFLKDLVELSIKGRSFGVLKQVVKNPRSRRGWKVLSFQAYCVVQSRQIRAHNCRV